MSEDSARGEGDDEEVLMCSRRHFLFLLPFTLILLCVVLHYIATEVLLLLVGPGIIPHGCPVCVPCPYCRATAGSV